MENLQKMASRFPILKKIEDASHGKIKQEHALLIALCLCILLTLSTPLGPLLTSTAGIIVPLKETLTCLKQVKPRASELRHLLIFWLLFGVLTALDAYSSWLVGLIPFFYTFKLVFLLWAGPLKFNASEVLYDKLISKIPEDYYKFECAEQIMARATKLASEVVKEGKEKGFKEIEKKIQPKKDN
ncbi:hypothetical protein EDEG_00410 [Edhazardia aedis USNM 41457]|uniref:Protein YOP1 n=1 Tax=Edhazardia aedis (strain USNM 41457) TaxID=1003232 RepID=J9DG81_EDHAE|nr:hypothetical protein EDEG_00410 [Edhazardia aedis USNM 41457]|eukprot:EJW01595.1 hypothetical protein EDEG_00410 [Edhazardia aedis USNM 41457]